MVEQRVNSEVYIQVLIDPTTNPLGVNPSKGNQRTTQGKEKILTSVGIKPTTYGLDLPLHCRLSYEVNREEVGDDSGGESRQRERKGTYEYCAA